MAKGCGNEVEADIHVPLPRNWEKPPQESGNLKALTCDEGSSKPGTPGQGIETAPKDAQNLRHEQRRNLCVLQEW